MCSIKVGKILFLSLFLSMMVPELIAQKGNQKSNIKKVSRPEKWWAICHVFVAAKAYNITKESLLVTDSISATGLIGKDKQGGQLDAFKHAFWMASLSQEIKWRKVYRLGKAHEKGNYLTFKKGAKRGKKNLPDKRSSDMDLWNNDIGIKIGKENKEVSLEELQQLIIDAIRAGNMRILNKDRNGNFLDCDNQIIPSEQLKGNWENDKCLLPSNEVNY